MAEAAGLAAVTVVTMLGLSYFLGTCVEVPDWQQKNYGFTFHCPEGWCPGSFSLLPHDLDILAGLVWFLAAFEVLHLCDDRV